jgi:hypothetical protein
MGKRSIILVTALSSALMLALGISLSTRAHADPAEGPVTSCSVTDPSTIGCLEFKNRSGYSNVQVSVDGLAFCSTGSQYCSRPISVGMHRWSAQSDDGSCTWPAADVRVKSVDDGGTRKYLHC